MTIRLLTDWPYSLPSGDGTVTMPAGSVVGVFNAATEAGMIASGIALATNDAATWQPPSEAKTSLSAQQIALIQSAVPGDGIFHAQFSDTFRRLNTSAGSIAGGWIAKGPSVGALPLPAATGGAIVSQAVESELTTYWMRALPATPKRLQVRFSYLDRNTADTVFQTLALICTNSAANLVDNMGLHLTTNHATLNVQERILATGGAFVNLVSPLNIQPRLSLADGENLLTVDLDAQNNSGVVRLNQFVVPFSSPNLAANIGSTVAFETFNPSAGAVRWRLRIHEFNASW